MQTMHLSHEEKTLNNFLDVYSVTAQARRMANHSLVDFVRHNSSNLADLYKKYR